MHFCLIISVILSMSLVCFGELYSGVYKSYNKCSMTDGLILYPGQILKNPNEECGQVECFADSRTVYKTCVPVDIAEGYGFGDYIDATRPFPQCCEREIIKLNN